jgi:two-component system, OmpR family, sensor kinase
MRPEVTGTDAAIADQLRALQAENAVLQNALAQAGQALESFTFSVGHDLRAPLRHISAYAQILKEDLAGHANAEVANHLQTITASARQMTLMLDGLLALAKLGTIELKLAPVQLAPLIDAVRQGIAATSNAAAIQWEIASDLPAVLADAALLRQLLQHLLGNAVKFSAAGVAPCVQVAWQLNGAGWCEITITDNGVGFNPAFAPKLFQVFSRLHSAQAFEGLGLGLAHSLRIVQRHAGQIEIACAGVGQGCAVRFSLPLAIAS